MFANMPSALLPAMARAYGRPSFWPCHCQNVSVCPLSLAPTKSRILHWELSVTVQIGLRSISTVAIFWEKEDFFC